MKLLLLLDLRPPFASTKKFAGNFLACLRRRRFLTCWKNYDIWRRPELFGRLRVYVNISRGRTRFVCICIAAHHHSESTICFCLSLRVVFTSCIMHEVKMKCLCRFSLAATCAAVISMNWPSAHSVGQDPLKFMNNQPPPTPNTYTVRPTALCAGITFQSTPVLIAICPPTQPPLSAGAHSLFSLPMDVVVVVLPTPNPLNPVHFACVIEIISATRWPGFCHPPGKLNALN